MYHVYVLRSRKFNYHYVGLTNNIRRRSSQHNLGKENTTKKYRPFTIIYLEPFPDRNKARRREKYLKSGCGREIIKYIYTPRWRNR